MICTISFDFNGLLFGSGSWGSGQHDIWWPLKLQTMINIPNSLACFSIVYFVVHAEVFTATVFGLWAIYVSIHVCSALYRWLRELHIMTAISGSGDRRYDTKYQCPIQCTFLSCPQCRLMVLQRLRMCIAMRLAKIICDKISDINFPSKEKKHVKWMIQQRLVSSLNGCRPYPCT